ncbi:MAG: DUF1844 domain-containing protein [Desulfobacterales bacterium]
MSEEKKTFVVKDRRRFSSESQETEENKVREKEEIEKVESGQMAEDAESEAKKIFEQQKVEDKNSRQETYLPKINFQTFILSLNSSALVQLGLIEDPVSGDMEKNLPLAKQTIDMLGMLEEKTKGNLDKDEGMMLKSILYELRMMYVREIS